VLKDGPSQSGHHVQSTRFWSRQLSDFS